MQNQNRWVDAVRKRRTEHCELRLSLFDPQAELAVLVVSRLVRSRHAHLKTQRVILYAGRA